MFVIAGATGRTGGVVADALLADGKRVRVVVRAVEKGRDWRARGADVAVASLDDARALEAALAGARGFFALLPEDPSRGSSRLASVGDRRRDERGDLPDAAARRRAGPDGRVT